MNAPQDIDLVAQALRQHAVLGQLDEPTRARLAAQWPAHRFADGDLVAEGKAIAQRLGLLARGRLALVDRGGAPKPRPSLAAPAWFGAGTMPREAVASWRIVADGDALVAFAPAADVAALCEEHVWLRLFLQPSRTRSAAQEAADPHLALMRTPVRALVRRGPVTLPPDTPIRAAAQLMSEQRVSSVLLVEEGRLVGLVTDRDLRSRAIAMGLDTGRPLREVATPSPLTIDIGRPGFDALLLMARHNIHHVPVMDGSTVAGMITTTDVTQQHGTSAVALAGEIHKQTTVAGLAACAGKVRDLQRHLASVGATAYATGHIITAITDALTRRLLRLGEERLGAPPVDFAWVAAGSQARNEQTARSDQDNCMILDDAYDESAHGAYFEQLATWVCDGLDACGYVHCPGEMMAMTDKWRQPRATWAEYFRKWVDTPEPMALMLTCVFFDVRTVAGRDDLLEGLRAEFLRRTRGNQLFLAHMVSNALTHQPPLGLFGGLTLVRSGEHKGTIDLKHSGTVPVIDLARVYALAVGDPAVNTHDRLARAADSGEISAQSVRDLREAFEFLAGLRIRHQARQIAAGQEADNYLRPAELSNFERGHLKDAFVVIKQLQDVLAQRYQVGRF